MHNQLRATNSRNKRFAPVVEINKPKTKLRKPKTISNCLKPGLASPANGEFERRRPFAATTGESIQPAQGRCSDAATASNNHNVTTAH